MSSRYSYLQASDGSFERNGVDQYNMPSYFDTPMHQNVDTLVHTDWNDWLQWDGSADMNNTSVNQQTSSRSSDFDGQPRVGDNQGLLLQHSKSAIDERPYEDAPFEYDGSEISPCFPRTETQSSVSSLQSILMKAEEPSQRSYQAFSSLSLAEERELQDIAMPYHGTHPIPDDVESPSLPPSPPGPRPRSRKRKTSIDTVESDGGDLCQSKKRGHNAIEKRYRTNLNEKIVLLRQSIPSLRILPEGEVVGNDDDECDDPHKYGKAAILTRAVSYIEHLEQNTRRLSEETAALTARVAAFEKLAMSGSLVMSAAAACSRASNAESLQTIQADFKQIEPLNQKPKSKTVAKSPSKVRSKKVSRKI